MNSMMCRLVEHHDYLVVITKIECPNCGELKRMGLHGSKQVTLPVRLWHGCFGGQRSKCGRCRQYSLVFTWERYA